MTRPSRDARPHRKASAESSRSAANVPLEVARPDRMTSRPHGPDQTAECRLVNDCPQLRHAVLYQHRLRLYPRRHPVLYLLVAGTRPSARTAPPHAAP